MRCKHFFSTLLVSFILIGCGNKSDEAYNSSIQKGLDVLANEEYEKAEAYFEFALEENPKDKKATALLSQTKYYSESLQSFEEEAYDAALKQAESVITIDNGSTALITKSKKIIEDIEEKMNETMELTNSNSIEIPTEDKETNTEKEPSYSFEEFKGSYGLYESTPYESSLEYLIVLTDSHFIDGESNSGSYLMNNILDKRIKGDVLTIDYLSPETGGDGSSSGTISLKLENENTQKTLLFTDSKIIVYPISDQQIIDAGWSLPPEL